MKKINGAYECVLPKRDRNQISKLRCDEGFKCFACGEVINFSYFGGSGYVLSSVRFIDGALPLGHVRSVVLCVKHGKGIRSECLKLLNLRKKNGIKQ